MAESRYAYEEHFAGRDVSALLLTKWVNDILSSGVGLNWPPEMMLTVAKAHRLCDVYELPSERGLNTIKNMDMAREHLANIKQKTAVRFGKTVTIPKNSSKVIFGGISINEDLQIVLITKGSPAEKCGINDLLGHCIHSVNGMVLTRADQISDFDFKLRERQLEIVFIPQTIPVQPIEINITKSINDGVGITLSPTLMVEGISVQQTTRTIIGMNLYQINGNEVYSLAGAKELFKNENLNLSFRPPSPPIHRNYSTDFFKASLLKEENIDSCIDKFGLVRDPSESNKIMAVIPHSSADFEGLSQFTGWYCHYIPSSKILIFKHNATTLLKVERSSTGANVGFNIDRQCMVITSVSPGSAAERAGMNRFLGNEIVSVNNSPSTAITNIALHSSLLEIRVQNPSVYFYSGKYYSGECRVVPVTNKVSILPATMSSIGSVFMPTWLLVIMKNYHSLNGSTPKGLPKDMHTFTITIMTRMEAKTSLREILTEKYPSERNHVIEEFMDLTQGEEAVALHFLTKSDSDNQHMGISNLQTKFLQRTGRDKGFITGLSISNIKGPEIAAQQKRKIECRDKFETHCSNEDIKSLPLLRWVDFLIDMSIGLEWSPAMIIIIASVVRIHQISGLVAPPVQLIQSVKSLNDANKVLELSLSSIGSSHSITIKKGKGGRKDTLGTEVADDLTLISVVRRSEADIAGLRKYIGWVVMSVNGKKPEDRKHYQKLMKSSPSVMEFAPSLIVSRMREVTLEREDSFDKDPLLGFRLSPDLVIDSADKNIALNHRIIMGMSLRSIGDDAAVQSVLQDGFPTDKMIPLLLSPKPPPPYRNYTIRCDGNSDDYGLVIIQKKITGVEPNSQADLNGYGQFIGWYAYPQANSDQYTVSPTPLVFVEVKRKSTNENIGFTVDPPVVISGVTPQSAADVSGLSSYVGFLIVEVNSVPVNDVETLNEQSSNSSKLILGLQSPLIYCFSKPFYRGLVKAVLASEAPISPSVFQFDIKSARFPSWLIFCIFNGPTKENLSFDRSTPFIGDLDGCCITALPRFQVKRKILFSIKTLDKDASQDEVDKLFNHFYMREGILLDQLTYRFVNLKRGKTTEPLMHLLPEEKEQAENERHNNRVKVVVESEKKSREGIVVEENSVREMMLMDFRVASQFVSEITEIEIGQLSDYRNLVSEENSCFEKLKQLERESRLTAENYTLSRLSEEAAEQRMKEALRKRMQQRSLKRKHDNELRLLQEKQNNSRNAIIDAEEEALKLIKIMEQQSTLVIAQLLLDQKDKMQRSHHESRRRDIETKIREARLLDEEQALIMRETPKITKRNANRKGHSSTFCLTIIRCRNLYRDRRASANPFVVLDISGTIKKSSVVFNSLNPVWNETYDIRTLLPATLKATVYTSSQRGDERLGQGILLLQDSLLSKNKKLFEIKIRDEGMKERDIGTLIISINSGVLPPSEPIATFSKREPYQTGSIPEGVWNFGNTPPTVNDRITFYKLVHQIDDIDPADPNILHTLNLRFGPEPKCPNWYIIRRKVPSYSTVVAVLIIISSSVVNGSDLTGSGVKTLQSNNNSRKVKTIDTVEHNNRMREWNSSPSLESCLKYGRVLSSSPAARRNIKPKYTPPPTTVTHNKKPSTDIRKTSSSSQTNLKQNELLKFNQRESPQQLSKTNNHGMSNKEVAEEGREVSHCDTQKKRLDSPPQHYHQTQSGGSRSLHQKKDDRELENKKISTEGRKPSPPPQPFRHVVLNYEPVKSRQSRSPQKQISITKEISGEISGELNKPLSVLSNDGGSSEIDNCNQLRDDNLSNCGVDKQYLHTHKHNVNEVLKMKIDGRPSLSETLRSDITKVIKERKEMRNRNNRKHDSLLSEFHSSEPKMIPQSREAPKSMINKHSAVHDLMKTVTDATATKQQTRHPSGVRQFLGDETFVFSDGFRYRQSTPSPTRKPREQQNKLSNNMFHDDEQQIGSPSNIYWTSKRSVNFSNAHLSEEAQNRFPNSSSDFVETTQHSERKQNVHFSKSQPRQDLLSTSLPVNSLLTESSSVRSTTRYDDTQQLSKYPTSLSFDETTERNVYFNKSQSQSQQDLRSEVLKISDSNRQSESTDRSMTQLVGNNVGICLSCWSDSQPSFSKLPTKRSGAAYYNYVEDSYSTPLKVIEKEVNAVEMKSVYHTAQGASPCDVAKSRRLLKLIKNELNNLSDDGIKHALELLSVSISLAGAGAFLDSILVATGQASSPLQLPKNTSLTILEAPPRAEISTQDRCVCIVPLQPLIVAMKSVASKFFNVLDE